MKQVLAFDTYGTLLDTGSIATAIQSHAHISAEEANQVSLLWRRYQLEYTFRLNSMELYEPFDVVTKHSLQQAAAEFHLSLTDNDVANLMATYNRLLPFEDTVPALEALKQLPNVELVVFSNGTAAMVDTALKASLPESVLPLPLYLADFVRGYKPKPEIYHGLLAHLSELGIRDAQTGNNDPKTKNSPDVWLASGNPFDITGARSAGLGAIWVDRAGKGWTDCLPLDEKKLGPLKIVRSLRDIATVVQDINRD
ncbi:HAD-like domain-containing protein [Sparassis latifolia]